MKIVCVLGSPRSDGNSTTIARTFIETALRLGARVRTFELNRMNYRGCQGCCACKTGLDVCALRDDLTEVLEAIKEADAFVLATPVYIGDIPGQVKSFIDRTYSYLKPDYRPDEHVRLVGGVDVLVADRSPSRVPPGKRAVLILTQGAPDDRMRDVRTRYEAHLKFAFAVAQVHVIRATGVGPGGIPKYVPERYLMEAEEIANTIMTAVDK